MGSVNFCLFTLFSSSGRLGHGGVFLIGGGGFTEGIYYIHEPREILVLIILYRGCGHGKVKQAAGKA